MVSFILPLTFHLFLKELCMNKHTVISKTIFLCLVSLATPALYGRASVASSMSARCQSLRRAPKLQLLIARSAQAGNHILQGLLSSKKEEEEDGILRKNAEETAKELTATIAHLTEEDATMLKVETAEQRVRSLIAAKEADPSFEPSKEELKETSASLVHLLQMLQGMLPQEKQGETAEKVSSLVSKLTPKPAK
jgi:hypothetical protein